MITLNHCHILRLMIHILRWILFLMQYLTFDNFFKVNIWSDNVGWNADDSVKGHTVCLCSNSSRVFWGGLTHFISELALNRNVKILNWQNGIFKTSKYK